jgi:hypothetical protein
VKTGQEIVLQLEVAVDYVGLPVERFAERMLPARQHEIENTPGT